MNVKLSKEFFWQSGVIYQEQFAINHYACRLHMQTACHDRQAQNTAYDRLKVFIGQVLQDAVFTWDQCQDLRKWLATGVTVITLPDEPVDQIIGMMLYTKLNAIMEGRMIITDVDLSSRMGDEMVYHHNQNDSLGPLAHPGWWNDHRPIWSKHTPAKSRDKIVAISRFQEWKNHNLHWERDNDPEADSTVLFAEFNKNEPE